MASTKSLPQEIRDCCEPFESVETLNFDKIAARIGDCQVVCMGEATHGTSEFYRIRARLSQHLLTNCGFKFVAVEADWPDAMWLNQFVHGQREKLEIDKVFQRFPTWMWRNEEVARFIQWMRQYNTGKPRDQQFSFYGLDVYSMYSSIEAVLAHLEKVNPVLAEDARDRYGCLMPYADQPEVYGMSAEYRGCTEEVVAVLKDVMNMKAKEITDNQPGGQETYFDILMNARVVEGAERYYRSMYDSYASSWNVRDQHMFDSLKLALQHHGPDAKGIVWAHNSHCGDASATYMKRRKELNIGQLCRSQWRDRAYLLGFGTHTGTVAAADRWGGAMKIKQVRPSHPDSYERLCHDTGVKNFCLPLRNGQQQKSLIQRLNESRLERAIGVIYRPDTEMQSHYFPATLPAQFDELIWLDETKHVKAIEGPVQDEPLETFPFGL